MQNKNITLLEIYKERNKDLKWFNKYFSLAKGNSGRLFEYTTTNFRGQKSFFDQFKKFEKIENKNRSDWGLVKSGQEKDKQRVVNMLASKLFMRELRGKRKDKNFIFHKTEKGRIYSYFLSEEFPELEEWVLNYMFLLDGHYTNEEKYIIKKTNLIHQKISSIALNTEELIKKIEETINKPYNKYELIKKDFFYLSSFYDDAEFLELYLYSNDREKKELYDYITKNLKAKNDLCCISKKYKTSGNFDAGTFIDEGKVFYFTIILQQIKSNNIDNVIAELLKRYNFLYKNVNIKNVKSFIYKKPVLDVFYAIFADVLDIREELTEETRVVVDGMELEETGPQSYIDDTTIIGRRVAKQLFALKKKRAREIANYKCSLEKLNNCRYFTSKASKKAYIEVNHLIPQEFRNEFSNSIEVFANYTTICPHCHAMLHKAVDNERKPLINYLYNERADKLEAMGIGVELKDLYEFYNID